MLKRRLWNAQIIKWSFRTVGKTECLKNFCSAAGINLSFKVETPTDAETVKAQFSATPKTGQLAGILGVEERPLVLSDYVNDTRSSIVVLLSALVTDVTMIKIYACYDNEICYADRMIDVTQHISAKRV